MTGWRQKAGCWIHERWPLELACGPRALARLAGLHWEGLRNRGEKVVRHPGGGWECLWTDSSFLTVARIFPAAAGRLCARAFADWPLGPAAPAADGSGGEPWLCVILPVGGAERSRQFQAVAEAMLAQEGGGVEVLAVEHSPAPTQRSRCPAGVRYLHVPADETGRFNKSLAMNSGARSTRAPWLLLHDADIIPPAGYAREIRRLADEGWEAARLLRFIFLLDEAQTEAYLAGPSPLLPARIHGVHQNFPGGSTAVSREAYWRIGGHDERFVGWGGEDLEFLDRLKTTRIFPGGTLPSLHLWHPPAPQKRSEHRNRETCDRLRSLPVADRIRALACGRTPNP